MQPVVLPTALDRTSAQVLGFDATAYITDTPSTLHQRLNIPNTLPQGDFFGNNLASVPKKKDHTNTILGSLTIIGGALTLGILAKKGKLKNFKLQNLKNIKMPTKAGIAQTFGNLKDVCINKFKDIKKVITPKVSDLGKHIRDFGSNILNFATKIIKKK